MLSMQKI